MSKFNVGDRVTGTLSGREYIVRGIHEDKYWVEFADDPGRMQTVPEERLNAPFFEVGKRYECCGDIFEPLMVVDGHAFGRLSLPSVGGADYRIKQADVFHLWTEIT